MIREDKAPPFNVSRDVIEKAIAGQGFQLFKVKPKAAAAELRRSSRRLAEIVMRGPDPRIFILRSWRGYQTRMARVTASAPATTIAPSA